MIADGPMSRTLFVHMTPDEQRQYIEAIQERRLAALRKHEAAVKAKQAIRNDKLREQIEKQEAMLAKEVAALDKAIAKVEARVATMNALRLVAEQSKE